MPKPIEAARAIRHREGFAFLDSSLPTAGALSILACEPDLTLSGHDWTKMERELQKRKSTGSDGGGAIGWVGFDGEYHFSFYDRFHAYSHDTKSWKNSPLESVFKAPAPSSLSLDFQPSIKREVFLEMVERAKSYIAAGDIYQVCLSHPFHSVFDGDPWDYYERLREHSPAPYGAYLNGGNIKIASASPECFLRMAGRQISTRPIKGTRPRKADQQSDHLSSMELVESAKEIAELIMITDLERNDLGRVCEYGSVSVPELLKLEAYEQVFHLVSTVVGELRPEVSHVAALRACFPGGSISGAPKKRALEIIYELEPTSRGLYTGAIGYFGYNGESQFSMTIRTAVFEGDRAHFHVGAGIVADSDPMMEWEETYHKAAGLLLAARGI
jgi:aminodeoxychorismate synthase component I